ncbi:MULTISPECIES: peptide MFS transporter [unclassified Flavobacterium]|jgi:POT family proton-dependent oligopeptide transporter|uniref:peptide MFS transporter n=1 Tax=unclassified Flavobacterium TaxID=196869 RepID=UPI0007102B0B|nr:MULTISPECIES: peptide MFS transporter [unclassified Flavobacterium]KRD60138.1 amino acid transporter [Flavobacterium sp. Root935]MDQ1163967.1 POT family proton-dependent oligopeptide transporter [Flavobacterium sp. SORGH_AS_0622]TDX13887.1 POT family proton-dependent oligopeptide transporter [Flavobacterium sp. S87F.05.LMB.W.Kidney.N]BDU24534.1 MFS transporter [Flavobacterium sp. GSB-24]
MEKNITLEEIQNFEGKYPKQLWYLFFVEMWERFCFYGMRGVLTIFMVDQLFLKEDHASLQYGAIQAFVYAFTFVGGIFADKILGFKKSLFFGAIVMILGNLLIAVSPHDLFYYGIAFSIIGTGFFKPNVSSMVGELYKEDDGRRDAGYGMFYAGINVGGLFGGALCVYLGKYYSWQLCFLSAALVMFLGLMTFLFTKKYLGPIGDSPLLNLKPSARRIREIAVYVLSLLSIPFIFIMVKNTDYTDYFMYTIGIIAVLYFAYELMKLGDIKLQKKLFAAFLFVFFYLLFNAIYEQSGGSLSLFAKDNLDDKLLFFSIDPNIINNSSNTFFVVVLSPLIGLLWIWMGKRKIEPNTLIKFGIGFLFLAASFYIFYLTRFFANAKGIASLNVFTFAYLVTTIGELCLGPIGMSIITKLSPKRLFGMMMGLWFLASAFGQLAAGKLGAEISRSNTGDTLLSKLQSYTEGYYQLAIYSLVAGVVLIAISPLIKKLMQEVK